MRRRDSETADQSLDRLPVCRSFVPFFHGSSVGPSVRPAIRFFVRPICPSVRRSVGPLFRALSVGRSVGRSVGPSVRPSVSRAVGRSVRRSVGPSVGSSVNLDLVGPIHSPQAGTCFHDLHTFVHTCVHKCSCTHVRVVHTVIHNPRMFGMHTHDCVQASNAHEPVKPALVSPTGRQSSSSMNSAQNAENAAVCKQLATTPVGVHLSASGDERELSLPAACVYIGPYSNSRISPLGTSSKRSSETAQARLLLVRTLQRIEVVSVDYLVRSKTSVHGAHHLGYIMHMQVRVHAYTCTGHIQWDPKNLACRNFKHTDDLGVWFALAHPVPTLRSHSEVGHDAPKLGS